MSCRTNSRREATVSRRGLELSLGQEPTIQDDNQNCDSSSQIQVGSVEPSGETEELAVRSPKVDSKQINPSTFEQQEKLQGDKEAESNQLQNGSTMEMEYFSKPLGPDDNCDLNPEFAVICSFIAHFSDKTDLELNIEELKSSLEGQDQLDNRLVDLHVKFLKKLRRYFVRDQWEKALVKFASEYSYEDADEIEQLGYLKCRPSVKMQLLRRLLDAQFECDQKFKAAINACEADELRLQPMGRDIKGNTYWQRTDSEGNFRIFQEQPMDYRSWKAICSKPEELKYLIDELESSKNDKIKGDPMTEPYYPLPDIFPELFAIEEKAPEIEDYEVPETKKSTNGRSKKGRKGSRGKKSTHLPSVKEQTEDSIVQADPPRESTERAVMKQELKCTNFTSQELDDSSHYTASSTIESQVRSTLETLINRVVSSFDYVMRPLSLSNPAKEVKEEANLNNDKIGQKLEKKPRARQSKKDKPKEEILPRRSSSRIQILQQKKEAEEEERVKKMIENSASKSKFVPEPDEESRSRSVSSKNARQKSGSPDEEPKPGRRKRKGSKTWCRGKNKKKLSWDKDDSDLSSISSLTESNDESFVEEIEEQFKLNNTNLDDEFACEDEDTNVEPVIVKRARTARQSIATEGVDGDIANNSISIIEEDKPCGRCEKSNDPENILLCDICDDGWHTFCCLPPLMIVPDGDWFCPPCEHKNLLVKLKELFDSITELLAERERERIKRQKLRQTAPKREPKVVTDELLTDKRQRDVLGQLNDPIALQELDDELEESEDEESSSIYDRRRSKNRKKATNRKKPARRRVQNFIDDEEEFRVNYRKKNRRSYSKMNRDSDTEESESEETNSDLSDESEELQPKTRRARNCVSYRFQEYDELIASAIQAESNGGKHEGEIGSDEDNPEQADEADDDEDEEGSQKSHYGRGKDMATIEALAYQQENGIIDQPLPPRLLDDNDSDAGPKKRKKRARRLNDLDGSGTEEADSDTSFQASSATELDEDEDEDEDVTEEDSDVTSIDELIDIRESRRGKKRSKNEKRKKKRRRSSYESDESDFEPRTSRRAATKQVSYKESSDEDDGFVSVEKTKKVKRKNVLDSETDESNASWKSQPKLAIDDDVDDRTQSPTESIGKVSEVESNDVPSSIRYVGAPKPNDEPTPETSSEVEIKKPAKVKRTSTGPKRSKKMAIDETTVTPVQLELDQQQQKPPSPAGIRQLQHGSSTITVIPPDVRDPMEELNQYCKASSNNPTTMFSSYNETLSRSRPSGSPPPPAFYPEDEPKPVSSNGQPKKSKKTKRPSKAKTPPSRLEESKPSIRQDKQPELPATTISPSGPSLAGQAPQRFDQALPSRQTRPLVPMPPSYGPHASRNIQQPRIYSIQGAPPIPGTYIRGPLPNKYSLPPQTAQTQMHNPQLMAGGRPGGAPTQSANQIHQIYSSSQSPYGPLPPMQQSPRSTIPLGPYPGAPPPPMWSNVPISGPPGSLPQAPMQPMFYSAPGSGGPLPPPPPGMPNANFSIHQLLGSPYHPITAMPRPPSGGPILNPYAHPSMGAILGPSGQMGSQQSAGLSQSSADSSTSGNDKDTIMGMSDVISFIGDT